MPRSNKLHEISRHGQSLAEREIRAWYWDMHCLACTGVPGWSTRKSAVVCCEIHNTEITSPKFPQQECKTLVPTHCFPFSLYQLRCTHIIKKITTVGLSIPIGLLFCVYNVHACQCINIAGIGSPCNWNLKSSSWECPSEVLVMWPLTSRALYNERPSGSHAVKATISSIRAALIKPFQERRNAYRFYGGSHSGKAIPPVAAVHAYMAVLHQLGKIVSVSYVKINHLGIMLRCVWTMDSEQNVQILFLSTQDPCSSMVFDDAWTP